MTSGELTAMDMLLAGEDPVLAALKEQWARAHIVRRERDSGGFFVHFEVPPDSPIPPAKREFVVDDVMAESGAISCGFILSVRNGLIHLLECHVWGDGELPENPTFDRFYYAAPAGNPGPFREGPRNLAKLREGWR